VGRWTDARDLNSELRRRRRSMKKVRGEEGREGGTCATEVIRPLIPSSGEPRGMT
jgi:hypothetical protein